MAATRSEDQAKAVCAHFEKLRGTRGPWEGDWEDVRRLVRPNTSSLIGQIAPGQRLTRDIFDGTPTWCLNQLASGLHSYLTSPIERWFSLGIDGVVDAALNYQMRAWLEQVSDIMYGEYQNPRTQFNSSIHELYVDLCSFGTAGMYQDWNPDTGHLLFRTIALGNSYVAEGADGFIDTYYRTLPWNFRQCEQFFKKLPPKMMEKKDKADQEFCILHGVFPRTDRDASKMTTTNKPWASVWVCAETKEMIKESGFDEFPFVVPRWTKLPNETYGRGPALDCMPDIKMLNSMMKTVIKAAQKIVDPPLMVPDDGYLLPIKTIPGSLIYKQNSVNPIEPLETKGNIGLGLDVVSDVRTRIIRAFYIDWLIREKKKERQTQLEIADDREESMRMMAPMLGRQQTELLGPTLSRSYNILTRMGKMPPAPANMRGKRLVISYISPAARAQMGTKVVAIQQFSQDLATMAPVAPDIMDIVDTDEMAVQLASLRDVSRKIIRSPEQITNIRNQRAQKMVENQAAQLAATRAGASKDASVATKNLSEAGLV